MAPYNPRIGIAAMVGVVVQIALTIAAWGDWNSFFANPVRTAFVIASILLTVAAGFSGTSGLSRGKSYSPASTRIFLPIAVLLLFMIIVVPYCDRHDIWTIDGDVTRYLGFLLSLAGSIIRLVPVFALGHRFSGMIAIQSDHELKTDGIYTHVRHPSYAGLILSTIGWALIFRSTVGLVLNIPMLLVLLGRISDEEEFLKSEFGEQYRAYCRKTWRLLPFVY
jgi:protein-S-isoprenylcysteine O-methyltransferase Ste14